MAILTSRSPNKRRLIVRYTAVGVALGAAVAGAAFYTPKAPAGQPDYYGAPVYIDHAPSASPVDVRTGCRIAAFGVAPWLPKGHARGMQWESATRRALAAMDLPDTVIDTAIARLRAGNPDEAIGMGNFEGQGTSTNALYLPAYSTTYRSGERYTVCHDSQTRFLSADRREYAIVYRIQHQGQTFHIGEFLACGNVTRFFPAPPGWRAVPPAAAHGAPVPGVPPAAGLPHGGHIAPIPVPGQPNAVPEPSSLALALAGLAVVIGASRARKH